MSDTEPSRSNTDALFESTLDDASTSFAQVRELRALAGELLTYTLALEAAYSVWAGSRPSMAGWPNVAPDLQQRLKDAGVSATTTESEETPK